METRKYTKYCSYRKKKRGKVVKKENVFQILVLHRHTGCFCRLPSSVIKNLQCSLSLSLSDFFASADLLPSLLPLELWCMLGKLLSLICRWV